MAVGSVSFGNAQFQELVNRPQTYAKKPSAATGITGEKKNHTAAKIGVGLAATAIAATIGLGIAAKTGKLGQFTEWAKDKKVLSNIANGLKTAGDWLGQKADKVITKVTDKVLPKLYDGNEKTKKLAVKIQGFLNKEQKIWQYKKPDIQAVRKLIPESITDDLSKIKSFVPAPSIIPSSLV